MNKGTVALAYLTAGRPSFCFSQCLEELLFHDATGRQRIVPNGQKMGKECGSGGIVAGRNRISKVFLDETECEWLFFVDDDMGFAPETVDRLVACADPAARPVVGALCFAHKPNGAGPFHSVRYRPTPTLYTFHEVDDAVGFAPMFDYPRDQLVKVAATGAACVLIHRSAMEKVREVYGDNWWTPITHPKGPTTFSEDLSFSVRVAACDMPLFVHTGVRTTHDKGGVFWDEQTYDQQRLIAGVMPASEPVDVIVPVLRRPQNAAPFMRSLRASTGLARVFAVVQDGDVETEKAWSEAGARIVASGARESFAQKVNDGFAQSDSPWVFVVGDDVRFHPGWLDHAQHVAATSGAQVVGTNDLGNPRVVAGEHATHLLIRRSYVDEVGASWDGPGVVCHEGYRHWFVDDELVHAAKQRGVWAMALGSVVEHLHPAWGKASMDDVYELGQSAARADERHFKSRASRFLAEVSRAS